MRFLVLLFGLVLAGPITFAEPVVDYVTGLAQIEFSRGTPYSCRLFRQRVKYLARANAGLTEFLRRNAKRQSLSAEGLKSLSLLLDRAGLIPHEKDITVRTQWNLGLLDSWSQILDSNLPVIVNWNFNGSVWSENSGILPSEIHSSWNKAAVTLELETKVSLTELCFGANLITLLLTEPTREAVLELQSRVEWP